MKISLQHPVTVPKGTEVEIEATSGLLAEAIQELGPLDLVYLIKQCSQRLTIKDLDDIREILGQLIKPEDSDLLAYCRATILATQTRLGQ